MRTGKGRENKKEVENTDVAYGQISAFHRFSLKYRCLIGSAFRQTLFEDSKMLEGEEIG